MTTSTRCPTGLSRHAAASLPIWASEVRVKSADDWRNPAAHARSEASSRPTLSLILTGLRQLGITHAQKNKNAFCPAVLSSFHWKSTKTSAAICGCHDCSHLWECDKRCDKREECYQHGDSDLSLRSWLIWAKAWRDHTRHSSNKSKTWFC